MPCVTRGSTLESVQFEVAQKVAHMILVCQYYVTRKIGDIMRNSRSRSFAMILYEEDMSQMAILDYIVENYNFAFIRHDRDVWEEGTEEHRVGDLKKPHYHVVIDFQNPRSISKVQQDLGLKHIETCNFYFYVRYLIHLDDPKKFQYRKEEIETNMLNRVENAIGREYKKEEQDTRLLLKYIHERVIITFDELTSYAMEHDLLQEVKKNVYFYKQFTSDWR